MVGAALPQYTFSLPVEPSYAPEDFIVTETNREAHTLVSAGVMPAPVCIISGPSGSGKTHLSHLFVRHHHGARRITPEQLGAHPADTLLSDAPACVMEDLETVKNEEALAQLINAARAMGCPLLLTSARAVADLCWARADLASRLRAAHEVQLCAPDDTLLYALLRKGFADRQLRISEDAVQYLLRRMERSASAALRWVERIDAQALAARQNITVPFLRSLLESP